MVEEAVRKYRNRALDTAQFNKEPIQLAKDRREANRRGEVLNLTEDEVAFYDALETNDSAVNVLGDETLETIPASWSPRDETTSLSTGRSARTCAPTCGCW